jgi:predicted phosphodiesterase
MSNISESRRQINGELALEYLARYQGRPLLQIARIMQNENPQVFMSVDSARSLIRYYTGSLGSRHRKTLATKEFMGINLKDSIVLPEGDLRDDAPYILPKANKKVGVLSDMHIPYHDKNAVMEALEYFYRRGVNTIIFNGDTMDCYQLSRFDKDPRKRRFAEELHMTKEFLQSIHKAFPGVLKIYKIGNHEERYIKYIQQKAPEIQDLLMDNFDFPAFLEFGSMNIQYVTEKRMVHAGELVIAHGHEWPSYSGGVNPARTMYLKAKSNVLVGHFHRYSEHVGKTVKKKVDGAWSTGCLCDLNPLYMPHNEWVHGFAYVEWQDDGLFEVHNKKIIDGKVL